MTIIGTSIKRRLRRTIACVLAFVLILSHSAGVIAQVVPDIIAPTINPEIVSLAVADEAQVFTAQASDDLSLGDVSLHYRRSGENIFNRVLMQSVGDTGFFTITIETDPNDLRAFEYYMQALDLNANRTVSGFAFEPFVRALSARTGTTITQAPRVNLEPIPDEAVVIGADPTLQDTIPRPRKSRRWLWITLGVVAAGVVAAAAASSGGGSDDGGGPTVDNPNVPLTVIIGDPLP